MTQSLPFLVCLIELAWSAILKKLKYGLCYISHIFGTLRINIILRIPNFIPRNYCIWLKSYCKIIRKQTEFLCPCPAAADCLWKSKKSAHISIYFDQLIFIFCADAAVVTIDCICLINASFFIACILFLILIKFSIFYLKKIHLGHRPLNHFNT